MKSNKLSMSCQHSFINHFGFVSHMKSNKLYSFRFCLWTTAFSTFRPRLTKGFTS